MEHSVVKIYSQNIHFDWKIPFRLSKPSQSLGTGFFITNHGHILTCAHIIDNAIRVFIEVPIEGFEKYEVQILGICPRLDLALIKTINYLPKKHLVLGDANKVKIGDDVLAVGFPLGQEYLKLTKGIISGYHDGFFQTDAALNPGNSGGPLIKKNKVIGINSAGIRQASGVGYTIPISLYHVIEKELHNDRYLIKRPRLGIEYNNITQDMLDFMDSKCVQGIYISKIDPGAPILKSGLREGNIWCSFDDKKIDKNGLVIINGYKIHIFDYCNLIRNGEKVKISYWNGKKLVNNHFNFKEFELPIGIYYPLYEPVDYQILGGMIFMNLTINHLPHYPHLIHFLDSKYRVKPLVIISKILPGSTIHNIGVFKDGEIISEINNIKVDNVNKVRIALSKPIYKNKKYVCLFKNESNQEIVINLKTLLMEEIMLANQYRYPVNLFMQKLLKKN